MKKRHCRELHTQENSNILNTHFPLLPLWEYAINIIVAAYLHTPSHRGIKYESMRESLTKIPNKDVKIQAIVLQGVGFGLIFAGRVMRGSTQTHLHFFL